MALSTDQWIRLLEEAPDLAVSLDAGAARRLAVVMGCLQEASGRMNLTAIREEAALVRQHVADSLAGLPVFPGDARVAADLGSGGGFPLFPLASARVDISWTAIESVGKKCRFIEDTAREAGFENISVRNERGEAAGRGEMRGRFDVVTARAVGPVAALCETALPLLRIGGMLVLYKTASGLEEAERNGGLLGKLGGELAAPHVYRFEGDNQERVLVLVRKTGATPDEFPRGNSLPFRKPLW